MLLPLIFNHEDKMKQRFDSLDGIRGILAITVMMSHVIGSYTGWGDIRPFVGAHLSVFYFFMMSGFVLSYANTRYTFKTHCMLRAARLWPLMVVSSIGMLLIYYINSQNGGYVSSPDVFSPRVIAKNILLMHGVLPNDFILLNEPSWSISLEFWVSLLIPFFFSKIKYNWKIISILGLTFLSIHRSGMHLPANFLTATICMLIGSLCYEVYKRLGFLGKSFTIYSTTCLITCLISIYFIGSGSADFLLIGIFIPCLFIDKIEGDSFLKKTLSSDFLIFLGRISFPLYLLHELVIVSGITPETGDIYSKVFLCALFSICIAYAYAVCVDEPIYKKLKTKIINIEKKYI